VPAFLILFAVSYILSLTVHYTVFNFVHSCLCVLLTSPWHPLHYLFLHVQTCFAIYFFQTQLNTVFLFCFVSPFPHSFRYLSQTHLHISFSYAFCRSDLYSFWLLFVCIRFEYAPETDILTAGFHSFLIYSRQIGCAVK
jgi:hypothetical protein